jgi:hypothetical protein
MKYSFTSIIIVFFLVFGLNACKKDDDFIPIWYTIKNYSDNDVTLKSRKGEADIILKKAEIKEVSMKYDLDYDIVPNPTSTKIFEFLVPWPSIAEIYSYDYKLEYVVEGTAEKADIQYMNDKGGNVSLKNVSLPAKYQFKTFCNCFAGASAKRVGDTGNVKISLYKRGRFLYARTSETNLATRVDLDHW